MSDPFISFQGNWLYSPDYSQDFLMRAVSCDTLDDNSQCFDKIHKKMESFKVMLSGEKTSPRRLGTVWQHL